MEFDEFEIELLKQLLGEELTKRATDDGTTGVFLKVGSMLEKVQKYGAAKEKGYSF